MQIARWYARAWPVSFALVTSVVACAGGGPVTTPATAPPRMGASCASSETYSRMPPLALAYVLDGRLLARDGSLLAWLYLENRVPVTLEQVPQHVQQAVVAIEDSRFYEHEGVDLKGMARAAVANARSGDVQQGASTLTQQYVKNALLVAADTPEERKAA
ncbi:MAG: transglycosylase domain-containing protein, partial [Gemmatimonadetes bacterium]|nr:transglycosylase domain-containing protein [Gemmatimonadota bacterium]